jgi:hypothetical protein
MDLIALTGVGGSRGGRARPSAPARDDLRVMAEQVDDGLAELFGGLRRHLPRDRAQHRPSVLNYPDRWTHGPPALDTLVTRHQPSQIRGLSNGVGSRRTPGSGWVNVSLATRRPD